MNPSIDLRVVFKNHEINRQSYELTKKDENSVQLTDDKQIESNKCQQIIIYSDFCQTICFIKKLNSCLNYRQKVFNTLKNQMSKKSVIFTQTIHSSDKLNDGIDGIDQKTDSIHLLIKLKSMDHYLAIDTNWFVFQLIFSPIDSNIELIFRNKRILNLVIIRFKVEDSLSWLSTLGGAYSSLGEYDINCVSNQIMDTIIN